MIEILKDYQKQAFRTYADLGSYDDNEAHMIAGLITELGELIDVYKKNLAYGKEVDLVNVAEEWADIGWYTVNFINFSELFDKVINSLNETSLEIIPKSIIEDANKEFVDIKQSTLTLSMLSAFNMIITDILLVTSQEELEDKATKLLKYWLFMGTWLNLNREKALENNVNKLKARFPDKFSKENALNRDLDVERKILEQ